ncbi:MAG: hypothetical protein JOS17DRAFT_753298 [Linnemannia elongata]|nr:MAG: hypothetical protein JOS17DRAFT_753298 [Linnemannia elongata]
MNNDLITNHFPRKREAERQDDYGDRRVEQGSQENQRQRPPPAITTINTMTAEDEAAIQRLVTRAAKTNGPAVPGPSQQTISSSHDHLSVRKVFSSLVTALERHNDNSSQTPSFQENRNEDPLQAAITNEGMLLWREFCTKRAYNDDDRVTPEKLLDYIDLICLPYDHFRQRHDITSNQDGAYPLLVLSLQALVRPVLQLWVQRDPFLDSDMEFSQHSYTEGCIAEEGEWERNGQGDRVDMDSQSDDWPSTPRDFDLASGLDDDLEDENIDWSRETAVVQENALRPMVTKEEPDSVIFPSNPVSTTPMKHAVISASATTTPTWTHGRYKADEFEAATMYNNLRTGDNNTSAPIYGLTLTENVIELLEEWRYGLNNQMSIQELNKQYGTRWRQKEQDYYYHARITIVREFKRLVSEEGMGDDEAVSYLVTKQGTKAAGTLYNELCQERSARNKLAGKMKSTLPGPSSSSSSLGMPPPNSATVPSSCGGTSKVSITSAELATPSAKDTGVTKQAALSPSKGSTSNNHATEREPVALTATTSNASAGLLRWRLGVKNKPQYCASIPGMPEVWDEVTLDRTYRFPMFDDIVTVNDLWKFWTQGWNGGPSVRERSAEHGATWRKATYDPTIAQWYASRYKVAQEIRRLIERGWSEPKAVEGIEALRKDHSMERLARDLGSLNDIPNEILKATKPDALTLMMAQAKSEAMSNAGLGSGLTPPMGYVGGRRSPRTHVLHAATIIQEPLTEEMVPPVICSREDLTITESQFNRRTGGGVQFEPSTGATTSTSGTVLRGTAETIIPCRTATGNMRPPPSGSSSSLSSMPSSRGRRRRSRSRGAGVPLVESMSVSKYVNHQRRPRIQVKKEDKE